MPFGRVRHPLTVESDSESASATSPVPPRASMIEPGVIAPLNIRTVRISQAVANRETTFPVDRGAIWPMVDSPKVIGPRLKELRIALGFKRQLHFAREIGIEPQTYNPWEKGKRPLTFEGACLIRKKFRVPLDYLFFGDVGELPVRLHRKLEKAA